MKILPIENVREADDYTIRHEPILSADLMERAAAQCYKWIKKRIKKSSGIKIVAGPGNNGGDGLVIARMLAQKEFRVEVIILRFSEKESDDFRINYDRLKGEKVNILEINDERNFPEIDEGDVIVDAIFGSGLSKPVKGFVAEVIKMINSSKARVIAIDTPSGLFADQTSVDSGGAIIEADYTLSFQFPKLAFLFPENDSFVGEWTILPIGLHDEFIRDVEVGNFFVLKKDVRSVLKSRNKFSHKGTFGHALLISGSYGKMGAAVLAARASLRSGAGLVSAHIPGKGYEIMQTALPEAMVSIDESPEIFSQVPDISPFNAIAIGPGIGMEKQTQNALKLLIQNSSIPLIFDADAINILGENKTWIPFVPKGSIFTPHPREFERLTEKTSDNFERNQLQRDFSVKYQVYVILKGAFTTLTTPSGKCFFNSTGNAGMATAGSGDVLTGVILGLLAQGYSPFEASLLGVYLHGLAGDIAGSDKGVDALIAGDIIESLAKAFKSLYS